MRECRGCGEVKELGYRKLYCGDCGDRRTRYRRKNGQAERLPGKKCLEHESYDAGCTNCKRLHKYSVTPEKLAELSQIKVCEICGSDGALVLDHNHSTDEVRGMICAKCNQALGLANDSIAVLEAMISYLKERGSYGA